MAMQMQKLVCNVDNSLMEKLDEYAASLHVTRTAAVAVLLSRGLQVEEAARAVAAEQAASGKK